MFRAAYKDAFYIALRNALHAEVNSWRAAYSSSGTVDIGSLWQQVFELEPKTRNIEATTFKREISGEAGKPALIPLHALANAARRV
jgi:hypothetical protein